MRYKYRKINLSSPFSKKLILRPIIPISIQYQDKKVRYEALIDSGADFSILPLDLAKVLGIDSENSKEILFTGIDGDLVRGKIVEVNLIISDFGYKTKIVFAEIHGTSGILGQLGFFDKFIVKFDLQKEDLEIKPR